MINIDQNSIQTYITTLQGMINRFANNSSSCKSWCITVVSAILVFMTEHKQPSLLLITFLPILVFAYLDAYYLSMERQVVETYNNFIKQLQHGTATPNDVHTIKIEGKSSKAFDNTLKSFGSYSIYPFYFLLVFCVLLLYKFVHIPAATQ